MWDRPGFDPASPVRCRYYSAPTLYASGRRGPGPICDVILTQAAALVRSEKDKAAADLLWPVTAKSLEWRIRWLEIALEIPDTAESLRWIDRLAGAVPQNSITKRIGLAETYDILGRPKDPAILQKAVGEFTQILAEPLLPRMRCLPRVSPLSERRHGDRRKCRQALDLNPNL